MNIKRFIAENTQQALRLVKDEMGPDAVILTTRTIHSGEGSGTGRKEMIEVTAAMDYDTPAAPLRQENHSASRELLDRYRTMEAQINEIRDLLWGIEAGDLLKTDMLSDHEAKAQYACFKGFGLRGEIIRSLMKQIMPAETARSEKQSRDVMKQSLFKVLKKVNMGGQEVERSPHGIHAFIGPTGVGKTTTLAKLAARAAIERGKKVALVTVDTFRIAAVNQLEAYARIMGVPMEVASSREELHHAVEKHSDCDHIFVDTVGRSPRDSKEVNQLLDMLKIPQRIHGYLVLSATTNLHQLLLTETTFRTMSYESYIFTKLDEVEDASPMVNFLLCQSRPVSYFTTGQQVPEDLEPASKKRLARMILTGRSGTLSSLGYEVH